MIKLLRILRVIFPLIITLTLFADANSAHTQPREIVSGDYVVLITENSPRIIKQPNGPFAVYHFTQYAQGEYIGIVYHDPIRFGPKPLNAPWRYAKRFWQDEEWGSDVTSIAWSPSGKYLYIGTSNIYGSGSLYEIDLFSKTAKVIFPTGEDLSSGLGPERLIYIQDMNTQDLELKILVQSSKAEIIKEIKIR